jgi:hypothetical protein
MSRKNESCHIYRVLLLQRLPTIVSCEWVMWNSCTSYLQHTCNTLQHTATHCNTLQHTATHCKFVHKLHVCLHIHACMLVRIIHMQRTATLQRTATCAIIHMNIMQRAGFTWWISCINIIHQHTCICLMWMSVWERKVCYKTTTNGEKRRLW